MNVFLMITPGRSTMGHAPARGEEASNSRVALSSTYAVRLVMVSKVLERVLSQLRGMARMSSP
jgi:hypothetical protein